MPAGLVEHENSMGARYNLGGAFVEVKLHGFAVAGRLHEGCTGSAVEANCTQQVRSTGALIVRGART
jgi:hypothetical protein